MAENTIKSIKKTITWLILDNLLTWSVAYLFTGQIIISFAIAIVSNTAEAFVYYGHEKFWE